MESRLAHNDGNEMRCYGHDYAYYVASRNLVEVQANNGRKILTKEPFRTGSIVSLVYKALDTDSCHTKKVTVRLGSTLTEPNRTV